MESSRCEIKYYSNLHVCGVPLLRGREHPSECPWLERNNKCQRVKKKTTLHSFISKLYPCHGNWDKLVPYLLVVIEIK